VHPVARLQVDATALEQPAARSPLQGTNNALALEQPAARSPLQGTNNAPISPTPHKTPRKRKRTFSLADATRSVSPPDRSPTCKYRRLCAPLTSTSASHWPALSTAYDVLALTAHNEGVEYARRHADDLLDEGTALPVLLAQLHLAVNVGAHAWVRSTNSTRAIGQIRRIVSHLREAFPWSTHGQAALSAVRHAANETGALSNAAIRLAVVHLDSPDVRARRHDADHAHEDVGCRRQRAQSRRSSPSRHRRLQARAPPPLAARTPRARAHRA